jgi:hypothetical protein
MQLNFEKLAQGTANLNEQLLEDILYEVALTELENDVPEKVTMARALAETGGDTGQAALQYPKLRVIRLKAELLQYNKDKRSKTIENSVKRISFEIGGLINDIFDFIGPSEDAVKRKKTSFDEAFLWDDDLKD